MTININKVIENLVQRYTDGEAIDPKEEAMAAQLLAYNDIRQLLASGEKSISPDEVEDLFRQTDEVSSFEKLEKFRKSLQMSEPK